MALIHVPRPPKSAYDPDRPMSGLLKSQVDHLREAESKLPLRYRSEIYMRALKTEGEAARYIRDVTEAIHAAHADAERARRVRAPKRKRVIEIAAVADERAERARKKRAPKSAKKNRAKGRKK